jgi:hypothetical protein
MKSVLSRYARTEDGRVILDVYTDRLEDLYHDFDRSAPYAKKDLDPEFVDYLIACAREIGKSDFVIRINLPSPPSEEAASRVNKSIPNYFMYLRQLERDNMSKVFRTSITLLGIGLGVLAASLWVHQKFSAADSIPSKVFAEGLTVAAWVSLWESLATFLIQWPPHRKEVKLYERLARAPIGFRHLTR